jgi:hypothetical protein
MSREPHSIITYFNVILSAYEKSDTRLHRLSMVLGYLIAKGVDQDAIRELHDSKGDLTVTWNNTCELWQALAHEAWEQVGNEPPENVEHTLHNPTQQQPLL